MRKNLGSYFFPMALRRHKANNENDKENQEDFHEHPQQNFSWKFLLNIFKFKPKLFECLGQGYSPQQLGKDISAGITVGVLALPLAMAFAIASGATPQKKSNNGKKKVKIFCCITKNKNKNKNKNKKIFSTRNLKKFLGNLVEKIYFLYSNSIYIKQ